MIAKPSRTYVIISLQIEGVHCWPDVKKHCNGVDFLEHPHRHMFHIKVWKRVNHDDRDVEIILEKRSIMKWLMESAGGTVSSPVVDFGTQSCEQIAAKIAEQFEAHRVEVTEDGENGAMIIVPQFE